MMTDKSATAFRTISEVADDIGVAQHVLRFWETKFTAVKPMKRGGNRRYYRPEDVELLRSINRLLYTEGYTIKGVQKLLKEKGQKSLISGELPAMPAAASTTSASSPAVSSDTQVSGTGATMINSLRIIRDRLAGALEEARAA